MSADHAAVIREALTHDPPYAESDDATALLALDALVAERDGAREARDLQAEGFQAAILRAEAAEAQVDALRAELNEWKQRARASFLGSAQARVALEEARAERDALREALLYARDCISSPDHPYATGKDIYEMSMMMKALRTIDAALARVTPTETHAARPGEAMTATKGTGSSE